MIFICLFTSDNIPIWVQSVAAIITAYLAWATLSNKKSLDELVKSNEINQKNLSQLIEQNVLYKEEINIDRARNYKVIYPFLTGVVQDPTNGTSRTIRVKNIGANAINF